MIRDTLLSRTTIIPSIHVTSAISGQEADLDQKEACGLILSPPCPMRQIYPYDKYQPGLQGCDNRSSQSLHVGVRLQKC